MKNNDLPTTCIINCWLDSIYESPRGLSICVYMLTLMLKHATKSYIKTLGTISETN